MKEPVLLPQNTKEFTANGHKFTVSDRITAEKYKQYEKLVPSLTFGLTFQDVYNGLHKVFNLLNKQEFANAAVVTHNLMSGIKKIDDESRIHPALLMAALFILRDDEDGTVYDHALNLEKINDWQKEGLDMMYFFGLSLNSIHGFRETLKGYTLGALEEIQKEIQKGNERE